MTIQDLGSIGEFIAAIATLATLAYLAIQIRQNTRALRSTTFEQVSNNLSLTAEVAVTHPEISAILGKSSDGLSNLTQEERVRHHLFNMLTFRRLESIFVHRQLGSIDPAFTEGFERSLLSTVASGGGAEWWENAKPAFSESFVDYVDDKLATTSFPRIHPF